VLSRRNECDQGMIDPPGDSRYKCNYTFPQANPTMANPHIQVSHPRLPHRTLPTISTELGSPSRRLRVSMIAQLHVRNRELSRRMRRELRRSKAGLLVLGWVEGVVRRRARGSRSCLFRLVLPGQSFARKEAHADERKSTEGCANPDTGFCACGKTGGLRCRCW